MAELNRDALTELIVAAMASGAMFFVDEAKMGRVDPDAPLGDVFTEWAPTFLEGLLKYRPSLIEALTQEER